MSVYKTLGQLNPAANTLSTLYTAPTSAQVICSTLSICNLGVSTTYRVAIRVAGAAIDSKQYIVYEASLNQYDSSYLTLGIALSAGDIISVYAGTANISFNVFGTEIGVVT